MAHAAQESPASQDPVGVAAAVVAATRLVPELQELSKQRLQEVSI
jgi:hypothetical protein